MINWRLFRQAVIFGVIGVFATATHYFSALFFIENSILNVYFSNLIGYLCAISVSYFGHGFFTFQVQLTLNIFRKFIVVSVTTFLCSELILFFLEQGLNLPHKISLGAVVLTIPIVSFFFNKLWVYRHPNEN